MNVEAVKGTVLLSAYVLILTIDDLFPTCFVDELNDFDVVATDVLYIADSTLEYIWTIALQ